MNSKRAKRYSSLMLVALVAGCASFEPMPFDPTSFHERALTQVDEEVTVSALVISESESRQIFDVDLYAKGIQPVWLSIDNRGSEPVALLPYSVDPAYFAPLEVSYLFRSRFARRVNGERDKYFHGLSVGITVEGGQAQSGFVFTHRADGIKLFNVDVVGSDRHLRRFTFIEGGDAIRLYAENNWISFSLDAVTTSYDRDELRAVLGEFECCTRDANDEETRAPLNIAMISTTDDLLYALVKAGWGMAGHGEGTVKSGSGFLEASGVSMRAVGREADVVFVKVHPVTASTAYLRLWRLPLLHENAPVWLGQAGRIQRNGSGPAQFVDSTLHARVMLFEDLLYAQRLAYFGNVPRRDTAPESRWYDEGQVRYIVDGYRSVFGISSQSVSIAEVENLRWEILQW